jgi:hypothetical protein
VQKLLSTENDEASESDDVSTASSETDQRQTEAERSKRMSTGLKADKATGKSLKEQVERRKKVNDAALKLLAKTHNDHPSEDVEVCNL